MIFSADDVDVMWPSRESNPGCCGAGQVLDHFAIVTLSLQIDKVLLLKGDVAADCNGIRLGI